MSRSFDIGNVPVLEAPSIPSLYRRFQTTAALSDTAVLDTFLASLFDPRRRFLLLTQRAGLVLLVLVLPFSWLALWSSFARQCGCLPGPPNEMKHMLKDANTRCLEAQLSHTACIRNPPLRQERTQITAHTPKHCAVLQQLIGNRTMDRTYGVWRSFA